MKTTHTHVRAHTHTHTHSNTHTRTRTRAHTHLLIVADGLIYTSVYIFIYSCPVFISSLKIHFH
jgi:hypothetical protein